MKTNGRNGLNCVREYFARRGYRHFEEEYPDFGGMIVTLHKNGGRGEVAYYFGKPSIFEMVTTDELRYALECFERSGIPLRYAVTTSRFSPAAYKLADESRIIPVEL
jgi:hypothetical protein